MYNRMKRFTKAASRSGAIYLATEVADYLDLQKKVGRFNASGSTNNRPTITAENKEWLIFGRQSPVYARDSEKASKTEELNAISASPLVLKVLGTRMDNEKHYDLFEGSDFLIEPMTANNVSPQVLVKPEQMVGTDLKDITDSDTFEVGFARKQGFADRSQKSPFYHSSIALRMVSKERPASPDSVVLSGAEIKQVIQNTNKEICEAQHCNLVASNCYSASTFAMGEMVRVIDARTGNDEKNTNDIKKICSVLASAVGDNFGRGVSNNPIVKKHLTLDISLILAKRTEAIIDLEDIRNLQEIHSCKM